MQSSHGISPIPMDLLSLKCLRCGLSWSSTGLTPAYPRLALANPRLVAPIRTGSLSSALLCSSIHHLHRTCLRGQGLAVSSLPLTPCYHLDVAISVPSDLKVLLVLASAPFITIRVRCCCCNVWFPACEGVPPLFSFSLLIYQNPLGNGQF